MSCLFKLIVASSKLDKIAVLGMVLLSFGLMFAWFRMYRKNSGVTGKVVLTGSVVALFAVVIYGIFMTPEPVRADWPDNYTPLGAYFFYEDHIGRPVLMSEQTDVDGDGYFLAEKTVGGEEYHLPIWEASYKPFGQVLNNFSSIGVKVGDPSTYGIWWMVPFRFPGQYEDPELSGKMYYNWNRFYMPYIGRYNQADPMGNVEDNLYSYVTNNPLSLTDPTGQWVAIPVPYHQDLVQYGFQMACIYKGYGGGAQPDVVSRLAGYDRNTDIPFTDVNHAYHPHKDPQGNPITGRPLEEIEKDMLKLVTDYMVSPDDPNNKLPITRMGPLSPSQLEEYMHLMHEAQDYWAHTAPGRPRNSITCDIPRKNKKNWYKAMDRSLEYAGWLVNVMGDQICVPNPNSTPPK